MKKKAIFFTLIFLATTLLVDAQCVMCRAVAEDASKQDGMVGAGINDAILYLMGIPYLLLGTLAIVFFRKKIGLKFDKFSK